MTVGTTDGVSALFAFDPKTGAGKFSIPLPSKPSTCNDITIGPDGAAYVTNTATPQILRLAQGARQLEVWFTEPSLQPEKGGGLDGIAFGPDGNLYVNTVGPGELYRIDVKKGKATKLTQLTPSRQGRLDLMSVHGDSVSVETSEGGL
jgi:streptogramin lyase